MASIKFGNIVIAMAGKVSGNVYAKNKGGAYSRVWVKPTNPKSTAQKTVRDLFTLFSQMWRTLLAAERTSWIQGAVNFPVKNRLAEIIHLSGNALFVALNRNLADVGVAVPITTCPTPMETPATDFTSITASAGGNTLALVLGTALDANVKVKAMGTPNLSAGISSPGTKYRQFGFYGHSDGTTIALGTDWKAMFGDVGTVGQKIFIQLVPVNLTTGQIGGIITTEVVIGA